MSWMVVSSASEHERLEGLERVLEPGEPLEVTGREDEVAHAREGDGRRQVGVEFVRPPAEELERAAPAATDRGRGPRA